MTSNKTYKRIVQFLMLNILFLFFSCSSKKVEKTKAISQETLIELALKDLNLKEENTSFVSAITNTNDKNKTIIVIPESTDKNEEVYDELNTNIVIVNNKTGKITHRYFESSKTNGWISNAIFICDIVIDSTPRKLSKTKNAFGIIVKFRTQSQPNPYYSEYLSLFVKEEESIKKVLDFYPVYEYFGEVNMNSCSSEIQKEKRELITNTTQTNDFYDIIVKTTKSRIQHQESENGDCEPVETEIFSEKRVLMFDNQTYKESQN